MQRLRQKYKNLKHRYRLYMKERNSLLKRLGDCSQDDDRGNEKSKKCQNLPMLRRSRRQRQ